MDVTSEIIGNVPSIAGQEEFEQITAANRKALTEKLLAEYPGMSSSSSGDMAQKPFLR